MHDTNEFGSAFEDTEVTKEMVESNDDSCNSCSGEDLLGNYLNENTENHTLSDYPQDLKANLESFDFKDTKKESFWEGLQDNSLSSVNDQTSFFSFLKNEKTENVSSSILVPSNIIVKLDVETGAGPAQGTSETTAGGTGTLSLPKNGVPTSGGGGHGGDDGGEDGNRPLALGIKGHYDDSLTFLLDKIKNYQKVHLSRDELSILTRGQENKLIGNLRITINDDVGLSKSGGSRSSAAIFDFPSGETRLYTRAYRRGIDDFSLYTDQSTLAATLRAARREYGEGSSRGDLRSSPVSAVNFPQPSAVKSEESVTGPTAHQTYQPAGTVAAPEGQHVNAPPVPFSGTVLNFNDTSEMKKIAEQTGQAGAEASADASVHQGGGGMNPAGVAFTLIISTLLGALASLGPGFVMGDSQAHRSGQTRGREDFDLDLEQGQLAEQKSRWRVFGKALVPRTRPRAPFPNLKQEANPAFKKGRDEAYASAALQHTRTHNNLPKLVEERVPALDQSSYNATNHSLGALVTLAVSAALQAAAYSSDKMSPLRVFRKATKSKSPHKKDKP